MHLMKRPVAWLLSLVMIMAPMLTANAAMVGTESIIQQSHSEQTRASLQQLLDQQAAQQQLLAMGVDPDRVRERVAQLTDSELATINQGIDRLEAGGSSVLGVLLVIFIIFVITDVIGATDIFSFIHPVR